MYVFRAPKNPTCAEFDAIFGPPGQDPLQRSRHDFRAPRYQPVLLNRVKKQSSPSADAIYIHHGQLRSDRTTPVEFQRHAFRGMRQIKSVHIEVILAHTSHGEAAAHHTPIATKAGFHSCMPPHTLCIYPHPVQHNPKPKLHIPKRHISSPNPTFPIQPKPRRAIQADRAAHKKKTPTMQ